MTKYNSRKTEMDGITFDSHAEARRYQELRLLQRAGDITNLICHPRYDLFPGTKASDGSRLSKIAYVADFEYINEAGETIVEDVKGVETAVFRLKRNLFLRMYPHLRLVIVKCR